MNNVHVLPTEKPSRLFIVEGKLYNYHKPQQGDGVNQINVNIYITSDEEIKTGDYMHDFEENDIIKRSKFPDINGHFKKYCRKVILTTDEDLIKDGVQAIDIEFLEWFIQNPNCEEAEINKVIWNVVNDFEYKIIIPKEKTTEK